MSECKNANDPHHRVLLMWSAVGFGAVSCSVLLGVFVYKWFNELSKKFREKRMPRMAAVILTCMACERCLRLPTVYLRFHGTVMENYIVNTINSLIFLGGIYGTLFSLLVTKLISNFEGSVYAVSENEKRTLHILVLIDILCLYVFGLVSSVRSFRHTPIGKISRFLSSAMFFLLSMTLLFKVNIGFSKRLRSLVAGTSMYCRRRVESPVSTPPAQTPTVEVLAQPSPHGQMNDDDELNHSPRVKKRMSISNIKKSSVSAFDLGEQIILRVAAKSMVIAMWITVGICLIFISGILIVLGFCADYYRIFANFGVGIAYTVIALSLSFSLPHSTAEYRLVCGHCDSFLQHLVAFQTDQQVVDQLSSQHH